MKLLDERMFRAVQLSLRAAAADNAAEKLPDGVCGRMSGIALTYNVPDDYDTVFLPGCLTKTRAEKVNAGKVKLFADHGPFTHTHVGFVKSLNDVGDAAVMVADLFDTDAGRSMKEYLESVLASGADTGLSIGFRSRDSEWRKDEKTGEMFLYFKEIELREISITPVPAVPGTEVTSVRREQGESDEDLLKRTLRRILVALPERDVRALVDEVYASSTASPNSSQAASPAGASTESNVATTAGSATVEQPKLASIEERTKAFRESFALTNV